MDFEDEDDDDVVLNSF